MKAMIYTRFGPPEVLQLGEAPKPAPKAKEVLIRIHAATTMPRSARPPKCSTD